MAEHYNEPILSDRTLKYRRNVLALSVILIAICWYSDQIEIDDLSFFGIKLRSQSLANSQIIELLAIFLGYHVAVYTYYSIENFRVWLTNISTPNEAGRTGNFFPELKMFYKKPPSISANLASTHGANPSGNSFNEDVLLTFEKTAFWKLYEFPDRINWHQISGAEPEPDRILNLFYVLRTEYVAVRQKIQALILWDVTLPLGCFVVAATCTYQLLSPLPPA